MKADAALAEECAPAPWSEVIGHALCVGVLRVGRRHGILESLWSPASCNGQETPSRAKRPQTEPLRIRREYLAGAGDSAHRHR